MKKEKAMVEYQQNRKDATLQKVEDMIRKTKRNKKPITKTLFCKQAGVSLQYLYKYPDLMEEVNKVCIPTGRKKTEQNRDSKDTIITSLRAENKLLKNKLSEYEKDEKYKTKYDEAMKRIKELEKQLTESYNSHLDTDF